MTKLDDIFAEDPGFDVPDARKIETPHQRHARMQAEIGGASETFKEQCPKCRGSGVFRGYSGRALGQCYACKGRGFHEYKSSPEQRQKAREQAATRKSRGVMAWIEANPLEYQWMLDKAPTFDFARSMLEAVAKYGSLTEKQHEAVLRCIQRDAERAEQRRLDEEARKAREAAAPSVSMERVMRAFHQAQLSGIRYPKLRLDTFVFSQSAKGPIYVTEGDVYLGKITGERFIRSKACTDEQEARVLAAAADPEAAAIAYGRRFGQCSVCGRELTNKISVSLGIGPICRGRYGWG